ncbi:7-cyano-7-deazaguanine synthase [Bradyrhizobium sp. USDA 329]|uniref:7-cyano-7-deazaguanine synthase n=1 Tax=Bradyrhizobium sp. USDA 329 TaxID=3156310 RepID=UPI003512E07E
MCSICREFVRRDTTPARAAQLADALQQVIAANRSDGRRYDAVVAFSGGKDSTFLLKVLQEKFRLNLLAVTFDNGFLSRAAFENMRKVVAALHVDHVIVKYRQDRLNEIFLASALARVYPDYLAKFGSGVCISCIRMVMTAALRTAIARQISMVILGNSPGQVLRSEKELIYRDNTIPFAMRRQLFAKLAERTGSWIYDHVMLRRDEYQTRPFPYIVSPLPILGYDEAEIYRSIMGLGWRRPADVDPNSTNCRLNAFGIIRHKNLYGFHPYDYEMSQMVRLGSLPRDVAAERLADPEGAAIDVATDVERELMCGSCCRRAGGA